MGRNGLYGELEASSPGWSERAEEEKQAGVQRQSSMGLVSPEAAPATLCLQPGQRQESPAICNAQDNSVPC